jgi:hypothetical protein
MALPVAYPQVVGDVTLADVIADYNDAKTSCKPWHKNIQDWRSWYEFDHYRKRGEAKPGEQRYEDPTPTNIVDTAVGIILAKDLDWKAMGFTPDFDEVASTSQIEKYLAGLIAINDEREEGDTLYSAVFDIVRDGSAVLYSPWDNVLATEHQDTFMVADAQQGSRPMPGFHEPPIRTQVIDSKKTFWVSGGPRRWGMVFRVEKKSVYDVEAEYSIELKNWMHQSESHKRRQMGELIDHWRWVYKQVEIPQDPMVMQQAMMMGVEPPPPEMEMKWIVQHGIMFDQEFILDLQDTDYQDLPYTIGFFKVVDKNDPKNWSHSIIRPIESTVEMMENMINKRQRQINILASLPLVTKAMAGRIIEICAGWTHPSPTRRGYSLPQVAGKPSRRGATNQLLQVSLTASWFCGAGLNWWGRFGICFIADWRCQ